MIAYLKGTVAAIYEQQIVLEVNDIGYNVQMPQSSLQLIGGVGEELKVYTYLNVREDAMLLFGFLTRDDLELFKQLLQVGGIGPKGGLALLSAMSADDLRFAIVSSDEKTIAKAPGIGKKTAQRLIIELKDKISIQDAFEAKLSAEGELPAGVEAAGSAQSEALEALVALGYSQAQALKAVRQAAAGLTPPASDDVEEILKQALKVINQ
ncbi:MAG: Holliday junction branch migration protein RuvA [Lachnospiraceae bacterium]|nr:Holliday junction branch migration protein RuvA [Lachnospiraceae bacterium]